MLRVKREARRAEALASVVGSRCLYAKAGGGGGGFAGRPCPVVRAGRRRGSESSVEGRRTV